MMTDDDARELLTECFGPRIQKYACDWLHCMGGMGLAGREVCYLGGDPQDKTCQKFRREEG